MRRQTRNINKGGGGGKWAFKPSDHKKKLPTSKTYKYCEKVKGTTPNKTKVCKQLCHSMSKKGYVFNKGSCLTHCKNRQWDSPDKHTSTAKELK